MRVNGEGYLLMMGWMHLMCLLPARAALHAPLKGGRAVLACLFASLYSLLGLLPGLPFGWIPCAFCALVSTGIIAFGRQGLAALWPQLKAGLCYAGICGFLQKRGIGMWPCLALCTLLCTLLCRHYTPAERMLVKITWRGKSSVVPCMRDTGNSLYHPVFQLPVMVAGKNQLTPLLPEDYDKKALCPGFSLLPVGTVQGKGMLMVFVPDEIMICQTGRVIRACVAVSRQELPLALLPGSLQLKEDQGAWKKSIFSGKGIPPSASI